MAQRAGRMHLWNVLLVLIHISRCQSFFDGFLRHSRSACPPRPPVVMRMVATVPSKVSDVGRDEIDSRGLTDATLSEVRKSDRIGVVEIYDTTLRDGTQMEGISASVNDKLKIANELHNFGM